MMFIILKRCHHNIPVSCTQVPFIIKKHIYGTNGPFTAIILQYNSSSSSVIAACLLQYSTYSVHSHADMQDMLVMRAPKDKLMRKLLT